MAVHSKNPSFAELQKQKIASSVQESFGSISNTVELPKATAPIQPEVVNQQKEESPHNTTVEKSADKDDIKTVTQSASANSGEKKRKDVMVGIHVTEDERSELRKMFCSNGFTLATAYRAAMTYLRQDLEQGKAYITTNGEIFRK